MDDAVCVNFLPILSLYIATHANKLPFVFSEMDTVVMRTLNIENPVPHPLEFINIDDTGSYLVGHVTPISAPMQDYSLMFG